MEGAGLGEVGEESEAVGFADDHGKDLAGVSGESVEDDDLIVLGTGGELDFTIIARGLFCRGLVGIAVAV